MASNITVDTLTKGSTTLNTDEIVDTNSSQVCKAWVNFNGTGTVAIRDSHNVSSITDNAAGNYTANFATAMGDNNYALTGTVLRGDDYQVTVQPKGGVWNTVATVNSINVKLYNYTGSALNYDSAAVGLVIHGNA